MMAVDRGSLSARQVMVLFSESADMPSVVGAPIAIDKSRHSRENQHRRTAAAVVVSP